MGAHPALLARSTLVDLLAASATAHSERVAVEDLHGGAVSYATLAKLSGRLRDRLRHLGVRPGDRVGLCLGKSIDAVATIFGILECGAAYVPVDASAPAVRNAYILADCSVTALIVEERLADGLHAELERAGQTPRLIVLERLGGGRGLDAALAWLDRADPAPRAARVVPSPDDLAYILYTSGSTGRPKGVMLSHRNAVSFVDWCSETFEPRPEDRFSSHAPFHFDLSILDLYVPLKHGATLVLFDEAIGKEPVGLAEAISAARISVWYSTPSILRVLAQYGKLGRYAYPALRAILFAGEVFPVQHLRFLTSLLPAPRYYNLYGPTETNVCTFAEVPAVIPDARTVPFPIGGACSHCLTRVVDEQGRTVANGDEGELVVSGPSVMRGYWNLPERTARAFIVDPDGRRWYRTGDIVADDGDGAYRYVGRRDRMVKRRGYRIELGEIEAGLYTHPAVREAAVVALPDDEGGVKIRAFLACRDGAHPSTIELKRFCAEHLPRYMVPDQFSFLEQLPRTSTDKTDYQRLKALA
ncbi:MAG: amino acid adenylation domain-containing protein [Chloroflexi bacterium]|nr:amino acid adenylation domain-containing protein [Chloroflexota bacterium]